MSHLIDTTEMYLRTIFELAEDGVVPLRARIAERLGHSGPTVSQTIARMERDGLVRLTGDRHLELTETGTTAAVRVMRKHRLAERLLVDVIGLEWEYVHDEACRWEHVMSDRVERKLLGILSRPTRSPYGNVIPGLAELGGADLGGQDALDGADVALPRVLPASGALVDVQLARLGEPVQTDVEAMAGLSGAGLRPGAKAKARRIPGGVSLADVELSDDLASHVFVARSAEAPPS